MSMDIYANDYHDAGICDFCGRKKCDPSLMFQMFWRCGITHDFCDLECLQKFKQACAIDEDAVFEGPPGTAKHLLEQYEKEHRYDT